MDHEERRGPAAFDAYLDGVLARATDAGDNVDLPDPVSKILIRFGAALCDHCIMLDNIEQVDNEIVAMLCGRCRIQVASRSGRCATPRCTRPPFVDKMGVPRPLCPACFNDVRVAARCQTRACKGRPFIDDAGRCAPLCIRCHHRGRSAVISV